LFLQAPHKVFVQKSTSYGFSFPYCKIFRIKFMRALSEDVLNFVDEARLIVFSLDAFGNISDWNRQVAFLTGFSSEDLIGSPLKVNVVVYEFIMRS
jgi:PAS domain-containing protein